MAETGADEGNVTVPSLPPTARPASASAAPCSVPEHLQRRAPARVEITDDSGRALRMTGRFIHVSAGTKVRVRVVPPALGSDKPRPTVELGATDALRRIGPQHAVTEGAVDVAVALYLARQRGRSPFPRRAELHVTVAESGNEPFTLVIPFAVWPSWWLLLGICVSVFAGSSVLLGWLYSLRGAIGPLGDGSSLSMTVLLAVFVLFAGLGASAALRLVGWISAWLGWLAADAE
jgi:hypothetical protein